jgi:8-oxo-dGTP pyrophosphatase MutT (NUDIX family)
VVAFMTGEPSVAAKDAATVILVRHGEPVGTPWQCFMVRRHVRSEFAADVYVFPGGKVDAEDTADALTPYVEGHQSPLEEQGALWRGLRVAAIRELFEEAGVLLAGRRDGPLLSLRGAEGERFARYRAQLQAGAMDMLDLAREEDLTYRADLLHPFSRWITPEGFPRRYDTRFYVAYLPDGQEPVHDAIETTHGAWIAPAEALQRYRDGKFPLVYATEKHLERMAGYRSVEEMIAATGAADLFPVMPKLIERDGEEAFLLPGEPGY